MSRIVIEDLPEIQDLSATELQEIYGAGRPVRRKSRESFPGIVHLELLERREVFSATGLQGIVQAPTAQNVAVEMQGSNVEKDSAGNTVFTQSEKGSVIAKAVFSPSGEILSYERTVGDIRVAADYQNGKVSVVKSWKGSIPSSRQELAADGSVTKETQYDSITGKKAVETTFNGSTRQVTVYVDGNTARVQTIKTNSAKKDFVIYEETWSGGTRNSQTLNTDSGELSSKWEIAGNYKIKTTVADGITDERTYLIRTQILPRENRTVVTEIQVQHEQKSAAKGLLLCESWDINGKLMKKESWLHDKAGVHYTVTSCLGTTTVEETFLNNIPTGRIKHTPDLVREESWNTKGEKIRQVESKGIHTEVAEYTTEDVRSGTATVRRTYVSRKTLKENGNIVRSDWFDGSGQTQRKLYKQVNGTPKAYLMVQYDGIIRIETAYNDGGEVVATTYKNNIVRWQEITQKGVVTSTLECYIDGIKKELKQYAGKNLVIYSYDRTGRLASRTLTVDGKNIVVAEYDATTGKPLLVTILDTNGKRTHQDSWEYQSGNVLRRSRDFNPGGLQEIQRREWFNQQPKAYYVWTHEVRGKTTEQVTLVNKQWEMVTKNGKTYNFLVRDSVNLADWTSLKDFRWTVNTLTTVPVAMPVKMLLAKGAPAELRESDSSMNYSEPTGLFLGGRISLPGPVQEILPEKPSNPGEVIASILDPITGGQGDEIVAGAQVIIPNLAAKLPELKISINWADLKTLELPKFVQKYTQLFDALPTPSEFFTKIRSGINIPALNKAWERIESIGSSITNAGPKLDAAEQNAQTAVDKGVKGASTEINNAKTSFENKKEELKKQAETVQSEATTAWDNTTKAVEPIVQMVKAVLTEDLIKVEADSAGKLSFNFATGSYYGDFEILAGLKISSEDFKALMTDNYKLPEIKPVEAAASLTGLKSSVTTNYDEVRQAQYDDHGGANVYFASKRFAEWAGPGTVARAVAAALAGDGGQILAEAKSHLSLELEDLAIWLQQRGAKDAPKLAVQILRAIVDQSFLDLPELSVEFSSVNFTNHLSAGGAVGAVAGAVGIEASVSATLSHMAFAIVWKSGSASDPLLDSINNFQSMKLQGGMDDFNALALEELDKLNLPGSDFLKEILLTGHVGVDSDNALDKTVMNKFSEMFGIDASELLAAYESGNPIIDLSQNSKIKDSLKSQLKKLAIGNDKSAELTTLQFNLNTMSFEVEFVVHHKYTSGSLADIGKDLVGMAS